MDLSLLPTPYSLLPNSKMPVTIQQLINWKQQSRTIVALTAWDYIIAQLLDAADVDLILVGDSMAAVLGYETTLPITLEEMLFHAKAVRRGIKRALMVNLQLGLKLLRYLDLILTNRC